MKNTDVNTVLAIFLVAFAVVSIGGLEGGAMLQPAAATDEDEDFLGDILDFALSLVDLDITQGDGGGDEDGGANVSQQDSNQDRTNRNVDSQGNVQRQSRQIVTDDGGGGNPGGPG